MRLDLIRHLPVRLDAGICYGRSDVPAHAPDPASLRELRRQIAGASFCISSPASRCANLARALFDDAQVRLDARLCEIDFGDWELRAFDAIERSAIDAWAQQPWTFRPPGGESAQAMSLRVLDMLDTLRRDAPAHTVILAHGGPLRVVLGHALGLAREHWLALPMAPGDVVSLRFESSTAVARIAWRGHLSCLRHDSDKG